MMLSISRPFSMLVTSHVVSVNVITFPMTNYQSTPNYGRKNVYSCKSLPRRSVKQSVTQTSDDKASGLHVDRLGDLTEDGLLYKENFAIRCYELGNNRAASIQTIANFVQEVGSNHSKGDIFSNERCGTTFTMRKMHLTWVFARIHIEVYKYPTWSDVIEIESWAQGDGKIGVRHHCIIRDFANGKVIGRSIRKCVMMNEDTRRLQRVSGDVLKEYLASTPRTSKLAFPEEKNRGLQKIAKLEDPAEYSRLGLVPRRNDLDLNNHVSHVTYIAWALESMPQEIIDTRELQDITLDYKRECKHGDIIDSLTSHEPLDDLTNSDTTSATKKDGEDLTRFIHLLRSADNGLEICRCRTAWRVKPAKG